MSKELEALKRIRQETCPATYMADFDKNECCDVIEQALHRLESIDNANPSEALECLEKIIDNLDDYADFEIKQEANEYIDTIKQTLLKAQKEHNSINLLMQELDCKDFAELRKYARCGYEKLNSFNGSKEFKIEITESSLMDYNPVKQYLKWEDLEFKEKEIYKRVTLNGELYLLKTYRNFILDFDIVELEKTDGTILFHINQYNLQFFNDLHLERVEE